MALEAASRATSMLSFDDACAAVAEVSCPLGVETVTLAEAHLRVLALPLVAKHSAPAAPVSAMDGYAVREADLTGGCASLLVVGECFAGDPPPSVALAQGQALRVFTGAPLPPGADRVVIEELVQRADDRVLIAGPVVGARHVRAAGADFAVGDTLLPSGVTLTSRALLAAAAADVADLRVFRRPRVSIVGTGSELADPGSAWRTPGAIPLAGDDVQDRIEFNLRRSRHLVLWRPVLTAQIAELSQEDLTRAA